MIGSGGAGKSVLARRLGELLGIEVVHLDAYFWRPGWVETPQPEWRETVVRLTAGDAWVMDGNYERTMDVRLPAADTIVLMDVPRWRCLSRAIGRWLRYRGRSRPDLAPGCPEQFDLTFLRWIWSFRSRERPRILLHLARWSSGRTVVVLRSPADTEVFLEAARAGRDVPVRLRFPRP